MSIVYFVLGHFCMISRFILSVFFVVMLVAAAPLRAQEVEDHDPLETMNRGIFFFNKYLDKGVIRPIAWGYRKIVPDYGRDRVGDFFSNLGEPVNFLNALLQGDATQAADTLGRFCVNTTLGVAGLWDQATDLNLPYRQEDFGQTLGHYGAGPGFYLVLPVLGPSSARDGVGKLVDWFSNPVTYIDNDAVVWGLAIGQGVHYRSTILDITDQIDESAIDPYATYRSAFLQRRADLISNGSAYRKF